MSFYLSQIHDGAVFSPTEQGHLEDIGKFVKFTVCGVALVMIGNLVEHLIEIQY